MLRHPVHLLSTGFGTGLTPHAPGTAGSLAALVPCWFLSYLAWPLRVAVTAAVVLAGVWITGASASRLGVHDHPAIVLDEIAAMLLLALVVPQDVYWLLAAFVLFRVFDIAKPWPIRDMDHRIRGGLGIMLDDLMAAAYAGLCLFATRYILDSI